MKDHFVKISNTIFDALCSFHLSGEETRVMNVILRKTYGFNKKEDSIALTQFVDMTGMDKRHVWRAIKNLEDKNIIFVTRGFINRYKFNKHPCDWRAVPK